MKTDWKEAHNPENLPPSAPGYRYLGEKEPAKMTDELWLSEPKHWVSFTSMGTWNQDHLNRGDHLDWTIRRALNVDDEYAPPPQEWVRPGYRILTPDDLKGPRMPGDEYWWAAGTKWESMPAGSFTTISYYRRPIQVANVTAGAGGPIELSGRAQVLAAATLPSGWIPLASCPPDVYDLPVWTSDTSYVQLVQFMGICDSFAGAKYWRHAKGNVPALPEPTLPPAPMLDGNDGRAYKMVYTKGQNVVSFGCAQISVHILTLLTETLSPRTGNRTVKSITLDSGVSINHAEIREILDYVEVVNKS
jgi:hypothetical protein